MKCQFSDRWLFFLMLNSISVRVPSALQLQYNYLRVVEYLNIEMAPSASEANNI